MKEKIICDTNVISRLLLGNNPEINTTIDELALFISGN